MSYIDDDKDTIALEEQWYNTKEEAIKAANLSFETRRYKPTKCSCEKPGCRFDLTMPEITQYRVVRK